MRLILSLAVLLFGRGLRHRPPFLNRPDPSRASYFDFVDRDDHRKHDAEGVTRD
jgi:hypothetical protein